jgi:hypothetical protein
MLRRSVKRVAWLFAVGVVPLFGLGAVGLVDYDESAYGDVARTMLASGDWLAPKLCGAAFFEKPPLLYWSAALGMKLIGVGPAGVRLATALAGLAAPLVLFGFARRPLGDRAAFAAALVLGTGLEFGALARLAYTDMLLLLWFTICVGALHRAFEAPERGLGWFALASGASALAILTKGAIGVLLPGAAGSSSPPARSAARRCASWLATGLALVVGLGFSWYLALGFTQPGGFAFMRDLFLQHHVGRFSEPMHGHGGSVLYYVPVLLVGLFPWSPFAPLACARAGLRGGDERARFLRLFALFSGITFVFFSIAATKLANYIAPALPGLALSIGALLAQPDRGRDRPLAWSLAAALAFAGIIALASLLCRSRRCDCPSCWANARSGSRAGRARARGGARAGGDRGLAGASAFAFLWRTRRESALLALGIASVCGATILFNGVAARVDAQLAAPLRRLAVQAAALVPPDQPIAMLGLRHRSSVCFSGERATVYASVEDHKRTDALFFSGAGAPIGITGEPQLARFPARDRLEVLASDGGYVLFRARR